MKNKILFLFLIIPFLFSCNVYKPYYLVNIEVKQKSPIDFTKYKKIIFTNPVLEIKDNKLKDKLQNYLEENLIKEFSKNINKEVSIIDNEFDFNNKDEEVINYLKDKNAILISLKVKLDKKQRSIIKEKKSGIRKSRYFVKVKQIFFVFYYKIYSNEKLLKESKEEIKTETLKNKQEEFNFKKATYDFFSKLIKTLKGNKVKEQRFLLIR